MSYYDDVFLQPPEPSQRENLVEFLHTKAFDDFEWLTSQEWFYDCVDWSKVDQFVNQMADQIIEQRKLDEGEYQYETRQENLRHFYD